MWTYIIRRLLGAVGVIIAVSVIVFLLMYLVPGDPAAHMLGEVGHSPAHVAELRERLGLNDPLYVQYANFIQGLFRGDLGHSFYLKRPVATVILEQYGATVQLAVAGMLLALLIGVTLGVLAAVRHNTWLDSATMVFALFGVSVPSFWLGIMLILFFSFNLGWFPPTGSATLRHLVMPAFALGVAASALIARLVRSCLLDVLNQDYIRTARAKGIGENSVIWKHALKNAMIPAITIIGLQFGFLLGGTVVIETVFSRQGLGRLAVSGILNQDHPMVRIVILLAAVSFILINTLVDLMYGFLDPRIRYD